MRTVKFIMLYSLSRLLNILLVLFLNFSCGWENLPVFGQESDNSLALNANTQFNQDLDQYFNESNSGNFKKVLADLSAIIKLNPNIDINKLNEVNPNFSKIKIKFLNQSINKSLVSKIWLFTNIAQKNLILIELSKVVEHKVLAKNKKHVNKNFNTVSKPVIANFLLELPKNITFNDAHWYVQINDIPKVNSDGKIPKHKSPEKNIDTNLVLVVSGNNAQNEKIYLKSYKLVNGLLINNSIAFECLPPNLNENFTGTAKFDDKSIDLNLASFNSQGMKEGINALTNTYSLKLYWLKDKFSFSVDINPDSPNYPATEFMNALANNNMQLAKSWLKDSNLISIPKYAKLIQDKQINIYKLISMAKVNSTKNRYRIITGKVDDLIIDVEKNKTRWFVTALFLAKPDNSLKSLTQNILN